MAKTIKAIGLILILTKVILGQPESAIVASDNKLELTANDKIWHLNIPERLEDAIEGSEFVDQVTDLNITDREKAVAREILSGNVPSFSRKLRPIKISQTVHSKSYELTFFATCDYMAIGSDQDYLYIPMTPSTAQYLADKLNCSLPTKKIVDIIYTKAEVKLKPQPIPPSDKMTTVPVFKQHTDSIKQQIIEIGFDRLDDNIIAGHKKDIIISNKIYSPDRTYDRVVIYGWHVSEHNPIQPVYNGHIAMYADYSHGVRLISRLAFINGDSIQVDYILKDPNLSILLSSEGVISKPSYPPSDIFTSIESRFESSQIDFKLDQNYPNPFNPVTTIHYELPATSGVRLAVYNINGQLVKMLVDETESAGVHSVTWNGRSNTGSALPSGMYVCRLVASGNVIQRKMVLMK